MIAGGKRRLILGSTGRLPDVLLAVPSNQPVLTYLVAADADHLRRQFDRLGRLPRAHRLPIFHGDRIDKAIYQAGVEPVEGPTAGRYGRQQVGDRAPPPPILS